MPRTKSSKQAKAARDNSPKRTNTHALVVILDLTRVDSTQFRILLLEPDQYTAKELEMLKCWTFANNIFKDYVIEEERFLPTEVDEDLPNQPTTLAEAKPHVDLWKKLDDMESVVHTKTTSRPTMVMRILA